MRGQLTFGVSPCQLPRLEVAVGGRRSVHSRTVVLRCISRLQAVRNFKLFHPTALIDRQLDARSYFTV